MTSTSAHHGERYFLTSLHCFIIRKTSINAAWPADCCLSTTVQLVMYRPLSRRLDRCDRVIQNESRDPFGGNVYYVTMQSTFLTRKFRNGERNLHCDVYTLPPNGYLASLSIAMAFSR